MRLPGAIASHVLRPSALYTLQRRATYYGHRYISWWNIWYRPKMIVHVPSRNDRAGARATGLEAGMCPATVRALAHVTRRVHEPDSSGSQLSFLKSLINKTHSSKSSQRQLHRSEMKLETWCSSLETRPSL